MSIPLDQITEISRAVAAEEGRAINVVGIVSSDADAERVELLVTIEGCHEAPCTLMLNLTRGDQSELESELRIKLCDAILRHNSRATKV